jgi:ATP-binding protein involved in chromosome partitioning
MTDSRQSGRKEAKGGLRRRAGAYQERKERMDPMKFAVPLAEGMLCSHFGHCQQFAIVHTEDGRIMSTELHTPPPHEPGVLPRWLEELGVKVVIAGGMGRRAQDLFLQKGITVVTGATVGTPEALIRAYLQGTLETGANLCDH